MKLKPRNESPGGMKRTLAAAGLTGKYSDYTTEELVAAGAISGVEASRRNLGAFYESFRSAEPEQVMEQFKWFIQERENVRKKYENGDSRPYSDDEVIDKTRFTNIFREDDRVSKFIFEKVKGLEGPELFYNLLISRLLNRTDTLSTFLPTTSTTDLSFLLSDTVAIMNSAAYQLSPGMVKNNPDYDTVREYIIYETPKRFLSAYNAMMAEKTISTASAAANKGFGGHIPFCMFQVVLDWNHLVGGFEDPSEIRVGQGAKVVIDALLGQFNQDSTNAARLVKPGIVDISPIVEELNKVVDRPMKPSDVEHAACEFRKYLQRQGKKLGHYSYKPNSMGI